MRQFQAGRTTHKQGVEWQNLNLCDVGSVSIEHCGQRFDSAPAPWDKSILIFVLGQGSLCKLANLVKRKEIPSDVCEQFASNPLIRLFEMVLITF